MEKFTKFADKGTGINPFVPLITKRNIIFTILKLIYGPILVLLRLPVVLICFFLLYLYHTYFKNLIIVKELRRMINLFVNLVLYRIILGCFGFFTFRSNINFFTRINYSIPHMGSGFFVLSNHTSPADILYLSYIMCPTFAKIMYKKTLNKKEPYIAPLDFWESWKMMMNLRGTIPEIKSEEDFTKSKYKRLPLTRLGEIQHSEKEGPVLIFFEGAVTNGQGVLEVGEELGTELYQYKNKYSRDPVLVSIRYPGQPNTTTNSPWWTMILLMANIYNTMIITITTPTKGTVFSGQAYTKEINNSFISGHQLKTLQVTSDDYEKFLDYFGKTKKKDYIKSD
jgi:hypothetical protein